MGQPAFLAGFLLLATVSFASAQQVPDLEYRPPLPRPTHALGKGPHVAIDEAHHNFHTADNRYRPFAELLRRDGYRVSGFEKSFSADSLRGVEVLVIANSLHERNVKDWSLPTPSAFTKDEITAVKTWVEAGGSLFLIVDHMPFPGAAGELAQAFGVVFSNGYARPGHRKEGVPDTFEPATGLKESEVTRGRGEEEKVVKVATFGGSAFKIPKGATPVLEFGTGSVSAETKKAPGITPGAPEVAIDGWCQGAVLTVGKGRVAVFGEAAMFTAQRAGPKKLPMGMNAPGAEQNYRLLLNVMHWLSR
jgi:hypothetical protein